MWVKIQHQMEVLNPIFLTPNMTAIKKTTKSPKFIIYIYIYIYICIYIYIYIYIYIFILHNLMKSDGFDRMFPFAKGGISEWGSRYVPKNN